MLAGTQHRDWGGLLAQQRRAAPGGARLWSRPRRRLLARALRAGSGRGGAVAPACSLTPLSLRSYDDELKENSRKYRRTVFDFDNWAAHRSTDRYNRHLTGMLHSRMVRGLARPLLYVVGVSSAVVMYQTLLQHGILPAGFPDVELNSREPFQLTSFALSLLLVFRTNASYARWLDARKTWGLVLNRSRDLVRQGLTWIPRDKPRHREMLCRWVPAFSRALMCHVRKEGNLENELMDVLLPDEVDAVLEAQHRPTYVLQVLSELVEDSGVSIPSKIRMDENLTTFHDCLGTCERILKTPIPLSYTRHTSRFMIIWLTALPFFLYSSCGWVTVPICVGIAFLLLGIEEIGVSIEEPFSILALEAICDSALSNVRELQATHSTRSGPSSSSRRRRRVSASELVQLGTNEEARRAQRAQRDGSSTRGGGGTEGGSASGTDSDPEWGYTAGAALMTLDTPEPFSQWAGNGILPRTPAAVQSEKRAPATAAQREEHAPAAAVQSEKHAPAAAERGKDGAA